MTTVIRQLRDFAVGAAIAILIATVAFVAVRNKELAARQIDLATRAADAIAEGRALPEVHAVIVGSATPSAKRPYLRKRQVLDGGAWRELVAGHSPDDKLFYDAASRHDRLVAGTDTGTGTGAAPTRAVPVGGEPPPRAEAPPPNSDDGATVPPPTDGRPPSSDGRPPTPTTDGRLPSTDGRPPTPPTDGRPPTPTPTTDGRTPTPPTDGRTPTPPTDGRTPTPPTDGRTPRADAATAVPTGPRFAELLSDGTGRALAARPASNGVAIAVTPPAYPAPFPLLVMIGLLGLGAALASAGALASGPDGRIARAGTVAGIAVLAIPCVLWSAWIATTLIMLLGSAIALAQHRRFTDRLALGLRVHRVALGFLAPAAVPMMVLVLAPFVIGLVLGFYDHHHGTWAYVGLHNFGEILSGGGRPLDDPLNFWFIFGVTVLWTIANVVFHVTIGVALALLLSRTWLRGKGVFRMLFILPWAVPNYITALIWKGMFDGEYGALNSLLRAVGLDSVSWFSSWATSFSANVITNTWLGFPFMMVVALGALETIPKELYEAASVDGASSWQRFRHITLPHLRPALGPAIALGSIWTFNMFNVIYLVSAGSPGGATNILVTDAYRWAFERGERYGMAAAYATIIFGILLLWTVFGARIVRRKDDES